MKVGYGTVCIAVEGYEAIYKIPNCLVGGVKNMGSILMNMDALNLFTLDVPAQMLAFLDYETLPARFPGEMGECGAIEAASYNQIVVHINTRAKFARIVVVGYQRRDANRARVSRGRYSICQYPLIETSYISIRIDK